MAEAATARTTATAAWRASTAPATSASARQASGFSDTAAAAVTDSGAAAATEGYMAEVAVVTVEDMEEVVAGMVEASEDTGGPELTMGNE